MGRVTVRHERVTSSGSRVYDRMVTVKDIAKKCNLSVATVSNALNDKQIVRPGTRQIVLKAAKELGYRPSAIARGLSGKKMNTIGVVFYTQPSVAISTNPYFHLVLDGIFSVCTNQHQNAMFCALPSWDNIDEGIQRICDGRCDGALLLLPPADSDIVTRLSEMEFPFVTISSSPSNPNISYVDVDNVLGSRQAANHLLKLGHRQVSFVMERRDIPFQFTSDRLQGARMAFRDAGLTLEDRNVVTVMEAYTQARALHLNPSLEDAPTAFMCLHDAYAMTLLEMLRNAGIGVPDEVSIIGFDDIHWAAAPASQLTTIRQDVTTLATAATDILLEQIRGESTDARRETFPTELIVRQTTAAPRSPA